MKLKDKKISICIWSEDYKNLARWYESALGFKVRKNLDLPNDTGIDFDFEDTYFFIGKHDKVKGKNKDPYRMMIGFNVKSVSEVKHIKVLKITM